MTAHSEGPGSRPADDPGEPGSGPGSSSANGHVLDVVWAKSPAPGKAIGELLTTHLSMTRDASRMIAARVGRISVTPPGFWWWAELACLLHDAGKVPSGFQRMVGNPGPGVPWGQRHEVYSLGFVAHVLAGIPAADRDWVALGVATHHRPLTASADGDRSLAGKLYHGGYQTPDSLITEMGPVPAEAVRALHAWLVREAAVPSAPPASPAEVGASAHRVLAELVHRWDEELDDDAERGLVGVLLQGAVTMADHIASEHSTLHTSQPLNASYQPRIVRHGASLRPHQAAAGEVDGHLLLRAPTGAGKTEAVLMWASRKTVRVSGQQGAAAPRVFYTLPYLASIDAMAIRLGTEVEDDDAIGVAHSRAASYYLARASCAADDAGDDLNGQDARSAAAQKAVARAAATRLFRETVRVGTPYQLMRAALAGTTHSGTLLDAVNSVFILDELHAYDSQRLGMLLAMLSVWERLGGHVGVISATLPHRLERLLTQALDAPIATIEPRQRPEPRHRLRLRADHLTSPETIDAITGRLDRGEAVLVVANNVADAHHLYEGLAGHARLVADGDRDAALLLHSRFKRGDRNKIEERIRARYGTGRPRRPGLLVATQVVEVSLDVDFDALHTSGAPLDALLQRFGRVNRLGKRAIADVTVHAPDYRPRRGSAETYADGIYEAEPTRLAYELLTRHADEHIDETDTIAWLDEIYDSPWGGQWDHEVDHARRRFADNFLTFAPAFHDRSDLADDFDAMFNGSEAILLEDLDDYRDALHTPVDGPHKVAVRRLLAADYLIPLPAHAAARARYDIGLKVAVIDADYDPDLGLTAINDVRQDVHYNLGEVL